jgi:hypothetical protein
VSACGRVGVCAAGATKWLNRTAQGFSPGYGPKKVALTERPTGTPRSVMSSSRLEQETCEHGFSSAALSGRIHDGAIPRAEALGYSV